ncbi:MAG: hypothetical protein U0T73_05410 [Chitinophagales bacterium]
MKRHLFNLLHLSGIFITLISGISPLLFGVKLNLIVVTEAVLLTWLILTSLALLYGRIKQIKNVFWLTYLNSKNDEYGTFSFVLFHLVFIFLINLLFLFSAFIYYLNNSYFFADRIDAETAQTLSNLGGFLGGCLGPLISLISTLLIFTTLKLQNQQLKETRESLIQSKYKEPIPFFIQEYEKAKIDLNILITSLDDNKTAVSKNFFNYYVLLEDRISTLLQQTNYYQADKLFIFMEFFPQIKGRGENEKLEKAIKEFVEAKDVSVHTLKQNQETYKELTDLYFAATNLLFSHLTNAQQGAGNYSGIEHYIALVAAKITPAERNFLIKTNVVPSKLLDHFRI